MNRCFLKATHSLINVRCMPGVGKLYDTSFPHNCWRIEDFVGLQTIPTRKFRYHVSLLRILFRDLPWNHSQRYINTATQSVVRLLEYATCLSMSFCCSREGTNTALCLGVTASIFGRLDAATSNVVEIVIFWNQILNLFQKFPSLAKSFHLLLCFQLVTTVFKSHIYWVTVSWACEEMGSNPP